MIVVPIDREAFLSKTLPNNITSLLQGWTIVSVTFHCITLHYIAGMDYCLRNKPRTLFDSPVCGNGFVEPGEECDCGLKEHCDNPCCNPDTCNMFPNATCATGECCDFKTCQPRSPGTVCR